MTPQAGDIILLAPAKGNESFLQRGIQKTGSVSTHNEIVIETDGGLFCGCASPPHYHLVPFYERVEACEQGQANMIVARWCEWPISAHPNRDYIEQQLRITAMVRMMAALRTPYDNTALVSIARNWVRAKIPFLEPIIGRQVEYAMYCTESVELIFRLTGINLFRSIGLQRFYAPVHVERVLNNGQLNVIANYGLAERLAM